MGMMRGTIMMMEICSLMDESRNMLKHVGIFLGLAEGFQPIWQSLRR